MAEKTFSGIVCSSAEYVSVALEVSAHHITGLAHYNRLLRGLRARRR
jgi:hypothetical protein